MSPDILNTLRLIHLFICMHLKIYHQHNHDACNLSRSNSWDVYQCVLVDGISKKVIQIYRCGNFFILTCWDGRFSIDALTAHNLELCSLHKTTAYYEAKLSGYFVKLRHRFLHWTVGKHQANGPNWRCFFMSGEMAITALYSKNQSINLLHVIHGLLSWLATTATVTCMCKGESHRYWKDAAYILYRFFEKKRPCAVI